MNTYTWNAISQIQKDSILKRPCEKNLQLEEVVNSIIQEVKKNGDQAICNYAAKFDQFFTNNFFVTSEEIQQASAAVSNEFINAIDVAYNNIKNFHSLKFDNFSNNKIIETVPGLKVWSEIRPIATVGLYIPGGTAPLPSTVLMLGIPALIAGCQQIVVCTPPSKQGKIDPHILFCLYKLGITQIYKVGGAQAIAAMAYGTETIPKVDKIFGPGNAYVTEAKQQVSKDPKGASIDMPAGPSEVMVIADQTSEIKHLAADLLSQLEHGVDSQAIFIAPNEIICKKVNTAVFSLAQENPRNSILEKSIANITYIICENFESTIEVINDYAPEHLIIHPIWTELQVSKIHNAGSVFIGPYTPESFGDYASGTNHVLPTSGYAKTYSGLSVLDFVKFISFQKANMQGLFNLGQTVIKIAQVEGLHAHAEAVNIRLQDYKENYVQIASK